MNTTSLRRVFLAGALLVLALNACLLGAAAWNRGGEPDAVLTLSARELQLPWGTTAHAENTGVGFWLQWRVNEIAPMPGQPEAPSPWNTGIDWLDHAKMAALGFAVPPPGARVGHGSRYARQGSRAVLLVLELDGPAYTNSLLRARKALEIAEGRLTEVPGDTAREEERRAARERLQHEETLASRLFVVDAGLSAEALRERWPDRQRYALMPGLVTAVFIEDPAGDTLRGFVGGPLVGNIHVAPERRDAVLAHWPSAGMADPGTVTAEIAFGRRLEPWLRALHLGEP